MNVPGLIYDITYWERGAPGGFGEFTWKAAVALKGRWQDSEELFTDSQGQQQVSRARAYLKIDVAVGGYLLEGSSVAADPTIVDRAFEIKQYRRSPPLRPGGMTERRALL